MELKVEQRQQVRQSVAFREVSRGQGGLWVIDGVDPHVEPDQRRYSFWTDCECPGDCLRDHENE